MNQAYQELAAHYQVLLDPCRARRPPSSPHLAGHASQEVGAANVSRALP